MKQLVEAFRSKIWQIFQQCLKITTHQNSNPGGINLAEDQDLIEESTAQLEKQIPLQDRLKKIIQNLLLNYQQHQAKTRQFKKASLFSDGKTNIAALSLVLRGVAEVLSQKMDLSWKAEVSGTLSYEQEVEDGKGNIFYYVTENPETPDPETVAEETALAIIEQFDPRACAIHLIYCALAASLDKPWEGNFVLDDRQLLEYTGLVKRRDLCRHEQLNILYQLLRQPAQVLACITWPKQGEVEAFTVADFKIWDITIIKDFKIDKAGNNKLVGLKVIGQPGIWTKYFLNKSKYYCHTGIITKKTVQKVFSIGRQNAGAARMLIWLTFQIQPEIQDSVMGKTLIEIAYGVEKVVIAQADRQLRRQLADDFETDLKVVKEAGWQADLEIGPPWLAGNNHTKRPIGFWDELLNTKWRFHLPTEVQERLGLPQSQSKVNIIQNNSYIQPPPGNVIREARKAKGWSRASFAAKMEKSVSWVDAVETSHRRVCQKDLLKLFDELDLHKAHSNG